MFLALTLVIFFVTQIIWPALLGRTMFPLFRPSTRRAEQKLMEARRKKYEAKISVKADSVYAEAIKHQTDTSAYDDLIDELEKKELDIDESNSERKRV